MNCFVYIVLYFCISESQMYDSVAAELVVQTSATDIRILPNALSMADIDPIASENLISSFPISASEREHHTEMNGRLFVVFIYI